MAVTFTAAGSGANGTGAIAPSYPAVTAGDLLLLHAVVANSTATMTSAPAGFDLLAGPTNNAGATLREFLYGKIATGAEAGTVSFTISGSNVRLARIYGFTGNETASAAAAVEDITSGGQASGTANMPTVDTSLDGNLAVTLDAQDGFSGVGSATGETGGDWTEATAEYVVASTASMQIQTAAMPTAGTISGGTYATTGGVYVLYGLGIKVASGGAEKQSFYAFRRRSVTR